MVNNLYKPLRNIKLYMTASTLFPYMVYIDDYITYM